MKVQDTHKKGEAMRMGGAWGVKNLHRGCIHERTAQWGLRWGPWEPSHASRCLGATPRQRCSVDQHRRLATAEGLLCAGPLKGRKGKGDQWSVPID